MSALAEKPGRSVGGLLPAFVMSSVSTVWAKAEHVSDDVIVGYQLISIPPDSLLEASRSVLRQALAKGGFEVAKEEVRLLRFGTRHKIELAEDDELEMVADYADSLKKYPRDAIVAACRNEPRWIWWPERGALLNRADAILKERRQLYEALSPEAVERAKRRLEAEAEERRRSAEWRPPSEEEKAAVTELVRKAREALAGAAPKAGTTNGPGIWPGSRSQRLFVQVLETVNAAAAHLGRAAQMETWELVAVAQSAGSWRAMAPDDVKKLRQLYREAKAAGVKAQNWCRRRH